MKRKIVSLILCVAMLGSMLYGCGTSNETNEAAEATTQETADAATDATDTTEADAATGASKYEDFITVDVFDSQANYQGIQSGWFAEVVKQKFNMELNIIAPNVAGGGDTLYQTRSAAGDLGDLILMTTAGGKLQDLVSAGLVVDMTDLIAGHENLEKYSEAISYTSEKMCTEPGSWAIPSEVSERSATTALGGTQLNSGHYLRWDLYKQLGYPELTSWDDLLNVMKDMQELCPESDTGKKTYAFSVFADWDGDYMSAAGNLAAFYGYGITGYAMIKADDSEEPQSLIDSDSYYVKGLQFFFDANQMGLLDPESTSQNYDTLISKDKDGAVFYSFYPWMGQSAYNTENHLSEGKGFEVASMEGNEIYNWGCYSKGNPNNAIMIGSKAEDPERLMDFIDWLYSPEGICLSTGQTSGSCGFEDLMWTMVDGEPALTEFGLECYTTTEAVMPEEYGSGTFTDGISQLNFKTVSDGEVNPNTGFPYNFTLWDSYNESNVPEIFADWQEHMDAKNPVEYFEAHDMVVVSPGSGYATPQESTDIATMRSQCKAIIVEYSWSSVFATDQAEFDSIIKEMQETVKGLGYDEVLAVDMQNAEDQKAARIAVSQ
ncbi:MAG: ABC transporter substrate-binding protein [Clostridiales bacterium]|nr:ABC transporter substrate-binding protein [Clostridiales bacterium]